MRSNTNHIDEEVAFTIGSREIHGILTKPASEGPHPAIVLLHGSDRSGKEDAYYTEHAETLIQSGFAVLRYDGPGWGGKHATGPGFETFEVRTEEAICLVKELQSRSGIQPKVVGLWGISQGGWICQMAAAAYEGVAFIISVSGPGVTPAEQEVFRVEAESRAAGFDEDEIAKAVLLRRLMVDIASLEPEYQAINQCESQRLGDGPWSRLVDVVYAKTPVDPAVEFETVLEVIKLIKDERWTQALHLDMALNLFENLPPQAWEGAKAQMRAVMDVDPADFLPKVHCPVLAIFGGADTSVPVVKSVALYKQYLGQAKNAAVTIQVFPEASHTIRVGDRYAPGYFETMLAWLAELHG